MLNFNIINIIFKYCDVISLGRLSNIFTHHNFIFPKKIKYYAKIGSTNSNHNIGICNLCGNYMIKHEHFNGNVMDILYDNDSKSYICSSYENYFSQSPIYCGVQLGVDNTTDYFTYEDCIGCPIRLDRNVTYYYCSSYNNPDSKCPNRNKILVQCNDCCVDNEIILYQVVEIGNRCHYNILYNLPYNSQSQHEKYICKMLLTKNKKFINDIKNKYKNIDDFIKDGYLKIDHTMIPTYIENNNIQDYKDCNEILEYMINKSKKYLNMEEKNIKYIDRSHKHIVYLIDYFLRCNNCN